MDLPAVQLLCLKQQDRSLEDHTRDFLDLACLTHFPDRSLSVFYHASLSEPCKARLPANGPREDFAAFVEWALESNGLYFSVCPVQEDLSSPTPDPEPSQLSSPRSTEHKPEPTAAAQPKPVAIKAPRSAAIKATEDIIAPEIEPDDATDQVCEPATLCNTVGVLVEIEGLEGVFVCCLLTSGVFGESVSVSEGDSVTLHTDVTEIHKNDDILWKFGAETSPIAEIDTSYGIFSTFNGTDGRFRDSLKPDNQTGSLTITNITTGHDGSYELEIIGAKWSSKTFSVTVYARLPVPYITRNSSPSSSSSSSSSSSTSSSAQNCSLLCSVVNVVNVTLSWYKGNSVLSSISVSDLSISLSLPLEVEYQDNNTYSCVLNNPISNQTQHLDISKLCHTCADQDLPFLYIVLISVAGSLLIVAAVMIFCICKKCRKTVQTQEEDITDSALCKSTTGEMIHLDAKDCNQKPEISNMNST
ncbi:uncharacterized protein [Garra rufa]|uniref:uncharacterized protein n=1 Tax=Garra rufa TaxID=137080 RepID=UPI003CCEB2F5